jgi:hypothetical protein
LFGVRIYAGSFKTGHSGGGRVEMACHFLKALTGTGFSAVGHRLAFYGSRVQDVIEFDSNDALASAYWKRKEKEKRKEGRKEGREEERKREREKEGKKERKTGLEIGVVSQT